MRNIVAASLEHADGGPGHLTKRAKRLHAHGRPATLAALAAFFMVAPLLAHAQTREPAAEGDVTVSEDAASFTLSNGIVTAKILKDNGDIRALLYKGVEL